MSEARKMLEDAPEEDKKLLRVRVIKVRQAIAALRSIYDPLLGGFHYFRVPGDYNTDLIVELKFGGLRARLFCSINGDPMYQAFDEAAGKYKSSVPIKDLEGARGHYQELMDEVAAEINSILAK